MKDPQEKYDQKSYEDVHATYLKERSAQKRSDEKYYDTIDKKYWDDLHTVHLKEIDGALPTIKREAAEVARLELENTNLNDEDGLDNAGEDEEEEILPEDGVEATKVASMLVRLGMSKDPANYMVNEQSINNIDILTTLDDKEIEQLCKTCRKDPNGTSKGIPLGIVIEANFKLAIFMIKLWKMGREIKDFKEELTSREDPKPEEAPPFQQDKAFEFFELFRDFLAEHTGSI